MDAVRIPAVSKTESADSHGFQLHDTDSKDSLVTDFYVPSRDVDNFNGLPAYGPLGTIGEEQEEGEEGEEDEEGRVEGEKPSDTIDTLRPNVPIDNTVSLSSLGSGYDADTTDGEQATSITHPPSNDDPTSNTNPIPNPNNTNDNDSNSNSNGGDGGDDDDTQPPSGLTKMKTKARGVAGLSNAKAKWMKARQRVLFSLRFGGALRDALKARMRKRWSQVKVSVGVQGKLLQHSKELDQIREETLENAKEKHIVTDEALYHRVPKWMRGDVNAYTREDQSKRRIAMVKHKVRGLVKIYWKLMMIGEDPPNLLSQKKFLEVNMRMYKSLVVPYNVDQALESAMEDWAKDSEGNDKMTEEQFLKSMGELVDMWTDTGEESDYVQFLLYLWHKITIVNAVNGERQWKNLDDIYCSDEEAEYEGIPEENIVPPSPPVIEGVVIELRGDGSVDRHWLHLEGVGFEHGCIVKVNGHTVPIDHVELDETRVRATVSGAILNDVDPKIKRAVCTVTCGELTSRAFRRIKWTNRPHITSIRSSGREAIHSDNPNEVSITLHGTNFLSSSLVYIDDQEVFTRVCDANTLSVLLPEDIVQSEKSTRAVSVVADGVRSETFEKDIRSLIEWIARRHKTGNFARSRDIRYRPDSKPVYHTVEDSDTTANMNTAPAPANVPSIAPRGQERQVSIGVESVGTRPGPVARTSVARSTAGRSPRQSSHSHQRSAAAAVYPPHPPQPAGPADLDTLSGQHMQAQRPPVRTTQRQQQHRRSTGNGGEIFRVATKENAHDPAYQTLIELGIQINKDSFHRRLGYSKQTLLAIAQYETASESDAKSESAGPAEESLYSAEVPGIRLTRYQKHVRNVLRATPRVSTKRDPNESPRSRQRHRIRPTEPPAGHHTRNRSSGGAWSSSAGFAGYNGFDNIVRGGGSHVRPVRAWKRSSIRR